MSAVTSPSSQQPADPWLLAADLFDPPADSDIDLARQCAGSLRTFIEQAWPIVEPAVEFIPSWHIDTVCEHLEAVTAGELPRLIINVPPRTMKSLSVAVFWPAWEWLTSPAKRWMFASYSSQLSQRDSLKMRRLIRSQGGRTDGNLFQRRGYQGVLRLLTAEPWELTKDQDAKNRYENTETGLRLATSVGAIATGEGGDRIVVDDPLNAEQARSDLERVAANTWWDETMTTRFNNSEAAAVIVMQRLHEQDLTGHLLERGGWHHLCLPAEYEPNHPFLYPDQVQLPSGRTLAGDQRTVEGEQLDTERLSLDRLDELHRDLGSYGYAGQMQQRPSPAEGGMFKRHWWRRYTVGDLWPFHFDRVVCSWDMRFGDSQKAASSFVVGQSWGVHGTDRYLLAQIRARLSFTETVRAVQALAAFSADPRPEVRALPSAHLVERKANGAAVMDTLRSKVGGLIPIDPEGGKDVRAAAVEPYVEAGDVLLPAGEWIPCPPAYTWTDDRGRQQRLKFEPTRVSEFVEEHAVFPNGSHDDQVDGMTQALNWLRGMGPVGERPETDRPAKRDDLGDLEAPGPRGSTLTGDLLDEPM